MTAIPWQIPRNALTWLLVAQAALLLPQLERLPVWISMAFVLAAGWRILVHQGRWSLPPRGFKVVLALACALGVYVSYGTFIGLEPTVALVISGFYLKLLEVSQRRDAYFILFLGFFIALTEFLFTQELLVAVYMLLPVLLLCAALVALHQSELLVSRRSSLKKAAVMLAHALPIMLLLFVVFPRIGPLWGVPAPKHQAKTGIADEIAPGDISQLVQDSSLALRISFVGAVPPMEQMYWRGVVMSDFDGRRWGTRFNQAQMMHGNERKQLLAKFNGQLRYSIIQEPTFRPWLFGLATAVVDDPQYVMMDDYRLISVGEIHERIQYSVTSDVLMPRELTLPRWRQQLETRLPDKGNPRARRFAAEQRQQATTQRDYIQRILNTFNTENFVYTLRPPPLGADSVDDFLFETRRGFCEHFASSFAFLMRAAGIPARVIAGYQGGELNPLTGVLLVHQFDAHAWVEVWLPEEGWQRIDPTAAVAPSRIERGLEAALAAEGSFLSDSPLSALRYRHVRWINNLRLQLDAINYQWARWVLGYGDQRQLELLRSLLGEVSPLRMAVLVLGVGASVLALIALGFWLGNYRRLAPEQYVYLRLCRRLAKAGSERGVSEGPIDFARRIAAEKPQWRKSIQTVTRAYVALAYEDISAAQRKAELRILRRESFILAAKSRR